MSSKANILKETARGLASVPTEDVLLSSREIFLYDPVTPSSMNELIKQLMYLERTAPGEEITLYINSPGGEVNSGLAAFDFMKLMRSPIRTVCIGCAASMGAILFLAGDKREMLPHAKVMIHDPSFGAGSFEGMKPAEFEENLSHLKQVRNELVELICDTTGMPPETVQEYTRHDSYFNSNQALESGIATKIITNIERSNINDL